MTIRAASFDEVFDGRSNYVPFAIVKASLADVARHVGASIVEGEDGLDHFAAVPLVLNSSNGPVRLALWRHDGNPPGTFGIHMALDETNIADRVNAVIEALDVKPAQVSWRGWDDGPEAGPSRVVTA